MTLGGCQKTVGFEGFILLINYLGIQSPCQMMIGVYNHLLSKVFRFHYHSQKVIGSLGINIDIEKMCLEGADLRLLTQTRPTRDPTAAYSEPVSCIMGKHGRGLAVSRQHVGFGRGNRRKQLGTRSTQKMEFELRL